MESIVACSGEGSDETVVSQIGAAILLLLDGARPIGTAVQQNSKATIVPHWNPDTFAISQRVGIYVPAISSE